MYKTANATLDHYRHGDWLRSARLSSTPNRTCYYDVAYAPFGETYAPLICGGGNTSVAFAGQGKDTTTDLYPFLFREYNSIQSRWVWPDPAGLGAVSMENPQSWNRYAYVGNGPLNATDPSGLAGPWDDVFGSARRPGGYGYSDLALLDIEVDNLNSPQTMPNLGSLGFFTPGASNTSQNFDSQGNPILGIGTNEANGGTLPTYTVQSVLGGMFFVSLGGAPIAGGGADGGMSAANNGTPPVSCNSTTGICVPSSMVTGPSNAQRLKNAVKWYLCGNGSFDNIKNYTLEGFTKGVIVGGIAGWEGGPPGVALGALGGGVEGFFGGNAIGWVATAGCQAAGMYGPAS